MAERRLARDSKFWLVTLFGALCLIISVANMVLDSRLRERRTEVVSRQQFISESQALIRLHGQLIQAVASLSAQSNDEAIPTMLAKYGVTFKANDSTTTSADHSGKDAP
jgi:hypothetical protein